MCPLLFLDYISVNGGQERPWDLEIKLGLTPDFGLLDIWEGPLVPLFPYLENAAKKTSPSGYEV